MRLLLIFTHPTNLGIRHSPEYITTAKGGGFLSHTKTQNNPNQRIQSDEPIKLVLGRSYEIKAYVYSTISNSQLDASIKVKWFNYTNTSDLRKGGGLRIREIKNYTGGGSLAGTETYIYDTAVTLTPFFLIQRNYSDVFFKLGKPAAGPYEPACDDSYYSPLCRIYTSSPVYAISTAMGSPMLYRRIQKITTDSATGAINGKTEYLYDVFRAETYPIGGVYTNVPLVANDWQNGNLIGETHYKYSAGNFSVVQKNEYLYAHYITDYGNSLRVQPKLIKEGCFNLQNASTVPNEILYYIFPTQSGSKRLAQQISTSYDDNGNKLETVMINHYMNSKYDFPTKIITTDSKNNSDSIVMKYSPDFAMIGNVYEKMEQRNILIPVIEQKSYNSATLLNTVRAHYRDWFGDGKVISPDSIQASVLNNALETKIKFYGYDNYNNPLSVSKAKDAVISYIWAHNYSYPMAQVNNASVSNIAYTSFETADKGNWTYTGTTAIDPTAPTGIRYYTLGTNIAKSGLSTSTTYIVSYWKKSGTVSVNGTTASTGRTANGWTYYEHKVVNPAGGTITVSGTSGIIDELRLYPEGAQMTTYNYSPLVGIISQNDVNNRLAYYEYDELQRLILVRDQDRNIIKKAGYNYHNQTEYPNIYYNIVKSGTYYKQGCAGCNIGSGVLYTVPAGIYLSTFSQADADSKAQAEVNAYGQAYANANGSCAAPANVTIASNNQISGRYFTLTLTNTCSNAVYTRTIAPGTTTISPAVPQGPYTVKFTKQNGPGTYTYTINGWTATNTPNDPIITGVTIYASGNSITIQL